MGSFRAIGNLQLRNVKDVVYWIQHVDEVSQSSEEATSGNAEPHSGGASAAGQLGTVRDEGESCVEKTVIGGFG